jgi:hypothetical protein
MLERYTVEFVEDKTMIEHAKIEVKAFVKEKLVELLASKISEDMIKEIDQGRTVKFTYDIWLADWKGMQKRGIVHYQKPPRGNK